MAPRRTPVVWPRHLHVDVSRMRENIARAGDVAMAEQIALALAAKIAPAKAHLGAREHVHRSDLGQCEANHPMRRRIASQEGRRPGAISDSQGGVTR